MSRPTYERLAPGGPVSRVVNDIRDGRIDATGQVTFAAGSTETELKDFRFTEQTVLSLSPLSAAAAAAVWWISDKARGHVVIGHDSVVGDTAFDFVALG